jgi:hypothetical protein
MDHGAKTWDPSGSRVGIHRATFADLLMLENYSFMIDYEFHGIRKKIY